MQDNIGVLNYRSYVAKIHKNELRCVKTKSLEGAKHEQLFVSIFAQMINLRVPQTEETKD